METREPIEDANPLLIIAAYLTTAATLVFSIFLALEQGILPGRLLPLLAVYVPFTVLETVLMLGHSGTLGRRVLFVMQAVLAGANFFIIPHSEGFAPILIVVLVSQAFFSFPPRQALAWGIALLLEMFALLFLQTTPLDALLGGFLYVGVTAFVWGISSALLREQQARAESQRLANALEHANAQLRESAARAQDLAVAQERTRLAREIHDSLGHYLTVLSVQLQAASKLMERDPKRAAEEIEQARGVVAQALADVRQSVSALRESSNTELHPAQTLPRLVSDFGQATGILAEYHAEQFNAADSLSPAQALTLYRAVQEGLTNAQKHAHASHVDVNLEQDNSTVRLRVTDNGTGNGTSNSAPAGFGLIGLRERVELLGGRFTAAPGTNGGFELSIVLPLHETNNT